MGTVRTFVVELSNDETALRLRSALGKLSRENAIRITKEDNGLMEFEGGSPSYALLEIRLLSPHSLIREREEGGRETVVSGDLPEWVEGIVTCPNSNCITVQPKEPTRPRFRIVETNPPKIQCYYCGRYLPKDSLVAQLS